MTILFSIGILVHLVFLFKIFAILKEPRNETEIWTQFKYYYLCFWISSILCVAHMSVLLTTAK
ncbi:Uncharacterised protein [Chlamydia abortus]|nr:Uncharacterised protein [Chlamydia abortus]